MNGERRELGGEKRERRKEERGGRSCVGTKRVVVLAPHSRNNTRATALWLLSTVGKGRGGGEDGEDNGGWWRVMADD